MKKKIIGIVAAIVTVIALMSMLVACNPYKWDPVDGGDPNAAAQSNGGYVVKQGNYIYFINGYVGEDSNNDWGVPVKQGIVRAEVDAQTGAPKADTAKLIVPKSVYNTSSNGGIAVYGNWVYYATPNFERDKNGVASTTDTDFMRTTLDGSVTQLIGRIASRSTEYMFTKTRVLYYQNNAISYFDFSGMNNKPTNKGKGVVSGTLVDNIASMTWDYASETIFYVRNVTGDDSYKNYNELCSIKANGTDQKTIATQTTFLTNGAKPEENQQKVYKFSLVDMYVEADGSVTLYYNKTYHLDSDKNAGLYMAKANDITTEKMLCATNSTTLYPLGYEEGALVNLSSNGYLWLDGGETTADQAPKITTTSQTVWYVDATRGYVYFSASSSPTSMLMISYKPSESADPEDKYVSNAVSILDEGFNPTPLKLDFIGDEFYFFATDDSNYVHHINLVKFKKTDTDADGNAVESEYIGVGRPEEE